MNLNGSYSCACDTGYRLLDDQATCEGESSLHMARILHRMQDMCLGHILCMYSMGSVNNMCLPVGLYIDVSYIIHNTCVVIGIPQHTTAKPCKMCIHVECTSFNIRISTIFSFT